MRMKTDWAVHREKLREGRLRGEEIFDSCLYAAFFGERANLTYLARIASIQPKRGCLLFNSYLAKTIRSMMTRAALPQVCK